MANSYDSSDEHRAVRKNGHDQAQDRDLRELRRAIDAYREENVKQHAVLSDALKDMQGNWKGATMLAKLIWGLTFFFLSTLGGMVGWGAARLNELEHEIAKIDSRTSSDWSQGRKWGEQLDKDILRLEAEIRELRGRINSRQK